MSMPWLHVDGKEIKDEYGNTAALRGLAGAYHCYTYNIQDSLNEWTPRLDWMKSVGLDAVRLRIWFEDFFGQPTWEATMDYYEAIIDLFESKGIYVILSCNTGYDLATSYYDGSWIAKWKDLATRFKDRSVIAAYDLANEGVVDKYNLASTRTAFNECIAAVRMIDNKHILSVYEQAREWRAVELQLAFPGISWLQNTTIWIPSDPPQDNNVIFKTGWHWLVLRPADPKAEEYYKDKFDIGYSEAANYVYFMRRWRDLFNMPVTNYEFGCYDMDPTRANYAVWRECIRLCNEASIPWNYHWFEHITQAYPTSWKPYIEGFAMTPYASPYFGVPQPFNPRPFNLQNFVVDDSGSPWACPDGPGTIWILGNVIFKGECYIRVRKFNGYPDERYLNNVVSDDVIHLNNGETLNVIGSGGTTGISAIVNASYNTNTHVLSINAVNKDNNVNINGIPFILRRIS